VTLSNEQKEDVKTQFLRSLSTQTDIPIEEIVQLLKDKFETFHIKNSHEYKNYILKIVEERENKLFQGDIKTRKQKEKELLPFPQCPICGGNTVGDPTLYNRYSKEAGWSCVKGGETHYRMWLLNRIMERKGLHPIFAIPETQEVITRQDYLRMDSVDYQAIVNILITKLPKEEVYDTSYLQQIVLSLVVRQTIIVPEPNEELLNKAIESIKEWKCQNKS
jgi:hypothetical protein